MTCYFALISLLARNYRNIFRLEAVIKMEKFVEEFNLVQVELDNSLYCRMVLIRDNGFIIKEVAKGSSHQGDKNIITRRFCQLFLRGVTKGIDFR